MAREAGAFPAEAGASERWSTVRRIAGYGAALSMSLYLAVKLFWVAAGLLGYGPEGYGTAAWVLLNAVTVVMAASAVALGLALAQRWGRRLPAAPVVLLSWLGAGFLVPMLPYTLISGVIGALGADGNDAGGGGTASASPGDTVFIAIGFTGMAVGLAVALPIYLRQRWPEPFLGRLGDGPGRPSALVTVAVAAAVGLGLLWAFWALGGTPGLDQDHRDHADLHWRLLNGSSGLWVLLGGWSVWTITHGRPSRLRRWIPMALAFGASGSLFAWGCWKLPLVLLRPGGFVTAEHTAVAVVHNTLSIAVGLVFMAVVLRTARRRDPAPRANVESAGGASPAP